MIKLMIVVSVMTELIVTTRAVIIKIIMVIRINIVILCLDIK